MNPELRTALLAVGLVLALAALAILIPPPLG
jgi:hypothetical protein